MTRGISWRRRTHAQVVLVALVCGGTVDGRRDTDPTRGPPLGWGRSQARTVSSSAAAEHAPLAGGRATPVGRHIASNSRGPTPGPRDPVPRGIWGGSVLPYDGAPARAEEREAANTSGQVWAVARAVVSSRVMLLALLSSLLCCMRRLLSRSVVYIHKRSFWIFFSELDVTIVVAYSRSRHHRCSDEPHKPLKRTLPCSCCAAFCGIEAVC